jgi:hypothetical protein
MVQVRRGLPTASIRQPTVRQWQPALRWLEEFVKASVSRRPTTQRRRPRRLGSLAGSAVR